MVMNAKLYAATFLEEEIYRLVKEYNRLVEEGDRETSDKEAWKLNMYIYTTIPEFEE